MNKIEQLHLDIIEGPTAYNNSKNKKELQVIKSTEITKDTAIKFGNFLGQKCNWINNAYYSYLGKTYTTEQLYEEFLKTIK